MDNHDTEMSRLMDYLPAVYQGLDDTDLETRDEAYANEPPFLNYFLLAFEKVLLGRADHFVAKEPVAGGESNHRFKSLKDEIADLHLLFEPGHTPERFLSWLAGWAALSLEASLSLERRRKLVANIIPLYRIRGTKAYLEQLLRLHLEAPAAVDETERPHLQVGRHSTVGNDTYLGGSAPHSFRVTLVFPKAEWQEVEAQCRLARRVIDLAKPAHTLYELIMESHRFQVGVHSTVGVDTIFGS